MGDAWTTQDDSADGPPRGRGHGGRVRRIVLWLSPIEVALAWVACVWLLHPHDFWSQNAIVLGLPVAVLLVELEFLAVWRHADRVEPRYAPRGRLRRLRRTAVFTAAVVFLLAGVGALFDGGQDTGTQDTQNAQNDSGQAARIVSVLNEALAAHDESAFLSVAESSAVPELTTWWNRISELGFTSGTIGFTDTTGLDFIDSPDAGSWSLTMYAGLRTAFDAPGKYDTLPVGTYQADFRQAAADTPMRIDSWKPLQQDPWDDTQPLYVDKQSDVLVVGEADERATVDAIAPQAETAAAYVLGLYRRLDPKDVSQSGFVVLASAQRGRLSAWLGGGAQAAALTGVGGAVDLPAMVTDAGGASRSGNYGSGFPWVSIPLATPAPATAPGPITGPLVAGFTDELTALQHSIDFKSATWPVTGFGMFVEAMYLTDPNPVPADHTYSTHWLTEQLSALPASYRAGALPTDAELQPLDTGYDWAEVAASVYAYIATDYGLYQTFSEVNLSVYGFGTPFGNVVEKPPAGAAPGAVYLHDSAEIQNGWARWLASL